MGITKFNSLEEAEQALWCYKPDQAYFRRIRGLFELAARLYPQEPEPGIRKYRSLEE